MSNGGYPPPGRFGGDMDRNEVEIDLNKFMALLQEKSELKERIRELEDIKNDNPYQKLIFVAQAVDSWRIIPRAFLSVYMYLLYYTTFWFMGLEDPTMQQSGLISVVVGAGAAWFGLYTNSSKSKGDFTKGDK
tara:strand:- start:846 stop:1244 length:399 start_codon:yes stop_codon:yes gene_type:complete